jgi:hypothetical protein
MTCKWYGETYLLIEARNIPLDTIPVPLAQKSRNIMPKLMSVRAEEYNRTIAITSIAMEHAINKST